MAVRMTSRGRETHSVLAHISSQLVLIPECGGSSQNRMRNDDAPQLRFGTPAASIDRNAVPCICVFTSTTPKANAPAVAALVVIFPFRTRSLARSYKKKMCPGLSARMQTSALARSVQTFNKSINRVYLVAFAFAVAQSRRRRWTLCGERKLCVPFGCA